MGHGPRRQRRRACSGRTESGRPSSHRLRPRVRHLPCRELRARQSLSAVRRARPSARSTRRPHRPRAAVGLRQRRRRRASPAPPLRSIARCRCDHRPRQPRRHLSHSPQHAFRAADVHAGSGRPTRSAADSGSLAPTISSATATRGRPITLTRAFIQRLSGEDDLGIPELTTRARLRHRRAHRRVGAAARRRAGLVRASSAASSMRATTVTPSGARTGARRCPSHRRGQADRPVPRVAGPVPPRARSRRRDATSDPAAGPPGLSRRRQRHQSPHADRRHRPRPRGDHAHAVLPEDPAPAGGAARPLRAAQQLRRQLSDSPASEHPRDRRARLEAARSGRPGRDIRPSIDSARCQSRLPAPRRGSRKWRSTRSCRRSARVSMD